jgi:1-phosphofructokinase family hexose kinase
MILCLGTTPTVQQTMLFNHIEPDEVNRAIEVRRNASGKPVNVARVLHTLGEHPVLCIPVGGDTGQFIVHDLQNLGISQDCVQIIPPTRTCVTVVDLTAKIATELVEEHGPVTAAEAESLLEKLREIFLTYRSQQSLPRDITKRGARVGAPLLVLSGALAAGIDVGFYGECCKLAWQAHVPTIVDGREGALLRALEHRPLLVKPNRSELAQTLGITINDDDSLRAAMRQLQKMGTQWVVTTLGRQGSMVTDGQSFWEIPAMEIEVVSAIGSGDAFTAGLAAGISHGQKVPEACRLATACAAANAMTLGAGLLRLEDVKSLLPKVQVQEV